MRRALATIALGALLVTACGDDDTSGACAELREPEDPTSVLHVIDPTGLTFLTDPPTSGPHLSGPAAAGLFAEPLPPASQVRVLETGGVVVQYREPVTEGDVRSLLAGSDVAYAIAPADSLPAPVVATAWTWKLTCDSPDLDRIAEFAATRTADAPGED